MPKGYLVARAAALTALGAFVVAVVVRLTIAVLVSDWVFFWRTLGIVVVLVAVVSVTLGLVLRIIRRGYARSLSHRDDLRHADPTSVVFSAFDLKPGERAESRTLALVPSGPYFEVVMGSRGLQFWLSTSARPEVEVDIDRVHSITQAEQDTLRLEFSHPTEVYTFRAADGRGPEFEAAAALETARVHAAAARLLG